MGKKWKVSKKWGKISFGDLNPYGGIEALQWFDNMPRRKDWKKCHSNMLWTHPDFLNRIDEMIWEVGADAPLQPGSVVPKANFP
eukprot:5524855-Amphidinium_carterae.1